MREYHRSYESEGLLGPNKKESQHHRINPLPVNNL